MDIDTLLKNIDQYLISEEERTLFKQAIELAQFDNAFSGFEHIENKQEAIQQFVDILKTIDQFYRPIGGLQGYHDTVVQLLHSPLNSSKHFLPPPIQDMRTTTPLLWNLCHEGTKQLRHIAHVFAVGGAGDRLQLIDPETNEPYLRHACLFTHALSLKDS